MNGPLQFIKGNRSLVILFLLAAATWGGGDGCWGNQGFEGAGHCPCHPAKRGQELGLGPDLHPFPLSLRGCGTHTLPGKGLSSICQAWGWGQGHLPEPQFLSLSCKGLSAARG